MSETQKLALDDGRYISYKYINNNSTKDYLFLYIHGYSDSIFGKISMKIEEIANKNKIDLIKFDLFGHGNSSGKKQDLLMDDFVNCSIIIVEKIAIPKNKKIIFIGSSIGGWISYILAEKYKNLTKAVVSIAGAVDFFTEIIEPKIKEENKNKELVFELVYDDGLPSGDFISRKLIESSKKYNLLKKEKINIVCPIRLIHGLRDPVVHYEYSIKFSEKVESEDVKLFLEKNMDHDLTKSGNLNVFEKVVDDLIKDLK